MNSQAFSQGLITFGLAFVPALFGIICHEVAHGWAAYKQGDPTAKVLGRLTLNPIRHLDPMGTLMFVLTAMLPAGFVIGWAKPVPVQPRYFKRPREGMMLVSLAGPLANFGVAILCALVYRLADPLAGTSLPFLLIRESAEFGIWINCTLAWFNLMPIPPMDGSHILSGFLPADMARSYESIGRYGMIIIIALLATGVFWKVLRPLVHSSVGLIGAVFGLPM